MKYYLASDHAGRKVKLLAAKALNELGIKYVDLSKTNVSTDDYPDFAKLVAKKVKSDKKSFGLLVCGTGIGMSIAANRVKGIRAALCREKKDAELARKHNDANVVIFSGWYPHAKDELKGMLKAFSTAKFEKGRHQRRLKKIEI